MLEYAERGSGPPFLMIHGTGGGFDPGLTFTEGLTGFRIVAPSRFAPTLVVSVEDDRFGTAATARDIAATIACAKLVIYPQGRHLRVEHDLELWSEEEAFVQSRDCT